MNEGIGRPNLVSLGEAAGILGLKGETVAALVDAGFLAPANQNGAGSEFAAGDVKAFLARNADNGSGNLLAPEPGTGDEADLLAALEGRTKEMAQRALDIFCATFPEALEWRDVERERFIEQSQDRFEAILTVASQSAQIDDALVADLREVGANAARAGSPLPQLLIALRISRDLVVQTAIEVADERGRHWSLPLALLLTRVLPAMDRLTDAIAKGYWDSVLHREEEQKARYEHVVEHSSDGVYEVDLDGRIQYANSSLGVILGVAADELDGKSIGEVVRPLNGGVVADRLLRDAPQGAEPLELEVSRSDGVRRRLDVRISSRRRHGELVGFQGVVRDVTSARDLEDDKNEFLALLTYDLRQPLTTMLGLGATLEAHGGELPTERVNRMGGAIRLQAERISRLADDLYDISRLESQSLLLSIRPLDLASTVEGALATIAAATDVEVAVPDALHVLADPHRLQQVVANLVENALVYGASPIIVSAVANVSDGTVELSVADRGPGVPATLAPALFNRLRLLSRRGTDAHSGTGLGLSLVRGLVEAMGGRVWYQDARGGGADFRIVLPARNRAAGGLA
ncbi:MAG: PAS domain-containing sensor histidine kinase [Acidimicrobiales bacterium]